MSFADSFFKIIADDILLFAYCDDSEIEPDFAVAQLERIASNLRALSSEDVESFLNYLKKQEQVERKRGENELAARLAEMPEHLGIV